MISPTTDLSKEILDIFNNAIAQIRPTPLELKKWDNIIAKITQLIEKNPIPSPYVIKFIEPQGSTGIKQTALTKAADIDLFIGLDPKILPPRKKYSKAAFREIIRDKFKTLINSWLIPLLESANIEQPIMNYAEHPYISAKYIGIDLDIVFCFEITESYLFSHGPITAVDRTPHHSRYIRDHLSATQRDEVRLLKQLFQSHHCYGDKSAVGQMGFIGYLAEIFIVYYGNLWSFMNHVSDLESKIIFSVPMNPDFKNPYDHMTIEQAREKFFQNDFLVVIDPTDAHRNVGSSVSINAYHVIKREINRFLDHPSPSLFEFSPLPQLKSLNTPYHLEHFFYIHFQTTDVEHYTKYRDKIYSLLDKIVQFGTKEATLEPRFPDIYGELIFDAISGDYILALFTSKPHLSAKYTRIGPKIIDEEHATKFHKKHPLAFEENGNLCAIKTRKFIFFQDFIQSICDQNPIKHLTIVKIGKGVDSELPLFVEQSMGNLAANILPFYLLGE